jgi:hypothetical protein
MCPACMTSIALIAAGGSSAGGLTVFAMTKLRAKTGASGSPRNTDSEGDSSGSTTRYQTETLIEENVHG